LNHGQIVASGPIDQLLSGHDGVVYSLQVKGFVEGLKDRLENIPWIAHTRTTQNNGTQFWEISISDETKAEANLLRTVLANPKIIVTEFTRKKYELEEVFMEIVKGDNRDR
jgi:ABC-type uncharacterized transport system ATPase subunit